MAIYFLFLGSALPAPATGTGAGKKFLKKKIKSFFLVGYQKIFFFLVMRRRCPGPCAMGARRAPSCTAQQRGPEGPHRVQHSSGGPKGPIVYSTPAHRRC